MRKVLIVVAALQFVACAKVSSPLRVWFNVPTWSGGEAVWNGGEDNEWDTRSLPIGNGSLGANVMGSISRERLTLNEKTLWTGGPSVTDDPSYYWDCNRQSAHILPEIWQAFLDGDDELATRLTNIHFRAKEDKVVDGEKIDRFGFMTTLGELHIETGLREGSRPLDFDIASDRKKHGGILKNIIKERYRPDVKSGPGETVDDYERSLSLDSALVRVAFRQDGVSYKREYFISHPDEVLAIKFSADRKKALNLKLNYLSNPLASGTAVSEGGDGIFYSGVLKNNGEKFALRIKAIVKDGKLESKDGSLSVSGASQAVFLVASATNYKMNFDPDFTDCNTYFKGEDPSEVTAARIAAASKLGWKRLLERHLDDYQSLFKRVDLQIAGDNAGSALPTPFRMDRYRKGLEDPGLEALYFQYGRYLLIASCREGNLPMNLQGIWCNELAGPWNTDYHNNVNIQEDFWPANQTNLDECVTPLVDYIRTMRKPGEKVAQAYYNARGWTVGISSNIYGFASPGVNESMISNLSPANGPWLATHLWDRYTFTMDKDYLADIYDLLAGSADYCCDFLWKHPDGYYTAAPTTSPEHGPIDKGVTFVHAVVREVLIDAMRAARVLGRDEERVKEWNNVLENLPPYQIGRYGQLMEWSRDIDDPDDDHRHVNHLFGLHPGNTISVRETPELADACRVVLEHRGDLGRGWSMAWKINHWARLHDAEHAYTILRKLLYWGTLDNLWDTCPPFNIDGNFGGCSGIAEMLIQSQNGVVELLPALPEAWHTGSVKGLCARGGFVVDMDWKDGKVQKATILSKAGEKCIVEYNGIRKEFDTKKNGKYILE